jgi:uncharacterized protein (TIGR02588 family)
MAEKEKQKNEGEKLRHEGPPFWEWIIAAAGFILVSGAVGFLLFQALTKKNQSPDFFITVNSVSSRSNAFLVEFQVENKGDETAAAVMIEGELKRGAEIIEKSSARLTYVPSHSIHKGGLLFSNNPNELELKIRVSGYEKP